MTRLILIAVLVAGLVVSAPSPKTASAAVTTVPAFDHVFVVVMENHSYGEIVGSTSAPYINSLVASGTLATSYYAITHPSLPNYLALTGASTFGVTSDCTTCWVSAASIADRLESAGKTWKGYMDSMPSACFVGDSSPYAQKHDPFIYFNAIRTNTARCSSHVVPYSQLATDLRSTATTPSFSFITPNMCNDMHDCSVATGDAWLKQEMTKLLASPAFTTQRSLLAITFDEDDSSASNRVPFIAVGSGVKAGYKSSATYNHYSFLRTVEAALGLSTVASADAAATAMTDLFGTSSTVGSHGEIDISGIPTTWAANQTQTFNVGLTNVGAETWPSGGTNPVRLDVNFSTTHNGNKDISCCWKVSKISALSGDVAPGGTTTVSVTITAPATAGSYYVEAQLFRDHLFWFPTWTYTAVSVAAATWKVAYAMTVPASWSAGQGQSVSVTLTNTGNQSWNAAGTNAVMLDVNFSTTANGNGDITCCWKTSQLFSLPGDVAPGSSVTMTVNVTAPATPRSYFIEAQLFKDHQFWFSSWSYAAVTDS